MREIPLYMAFLDPYKSCRLTRSHRASFTSFLISLDWDNKEETRKRSVYRLRAFLNRLDSCLATSERYRARCYKGCCRPIPTYMSMSCIKVSHSLNLQWQIYALFLNFQNFFEEILRIIVTFLLLSVN